MAFNAHTLNPRGQDTAATLQITFKLTREAAEHIISTALESGHSNWILEVERVRALDPDDPKHEQELSEALAYDGQALRFHHVALDGRTYNDLTLEKLAAGVAQYIEEGGSIGLLLRTDSDAPADAIDADYVLQYALFTSYVFD